MARFTLFGGAADTSRRIAEADSVAVIGLGRFGTSLALELMAGGTEVLGIDADEETVQSLNGELTQVVRADSTKVEALRQLAVDEFDRVVVAIGSDVTASILTCSVLLGMKTPIIWAKAVTAQHGLILEQLGVHHVIRPEAEMGDRVAHLITSKMIDFIKFEDGFAIAKVCAPREAVGKSLAEAHLRRTHGVTVVGVKEHGKDFTYAVPETVVPEGALLVISGTVEKVERFAALT